MTPANGGRTTPMGDISGGGGVSEMAWRISANYYEAGSCAYGFPCTMSGFPTHGFCEGVLVFDVTDGERDGVDLTEARAAAAVTWPGAVHEGNGDLVLFIDGTTGQQHALVAIVTAEDPGLPWELLAATIGTFHRPFFEPIHIEGRESDSRIQVGDMLTVQMESFKNPVTGEKHDPHLVLEDGFFFQDAHIGTTSELWLDADGVSFDHAGSNAYYSQVEWSSESRLKPAAAAGPERSPSGVNGLAGQQR
jgi:hypothetical protein